MNYIQPNPSAESHYPHIKKLCGPYLGEDWFYINSYLLDPSKYEFKYMTEVQDQKEVMVLLDLVLNLMCKNNAQNKQLIINSIGDIDRLVEVTPENDMEYSDLFVEELHIPNLPLKTWQEHKQFLLHLKGKLQQTLTP